MAAANDDAGDDDDERLHVVSSLRGVVCGHRHTQRNDEGTVLDVGGLSKRRTPPSSVLPEIDCRPAGEYWPCRAYLTGPEEMCIEPRVQNHFPRPSSIATWRGRGKSWSQHHHHLDPCFGSWKSRCPPHQRQWVWWCSHAYIRARRQHQRSTSARARDHRPVVVLLTSPHSSQASDPCLS